MNTSTTDNPLLYYYIPIELRYTRHGPMLYVTTDLYVGGSYRRYGEYSPVEVDLFSVILKPGMVAIDAGANMGAITIPMAKAVGEQGRVLAFEPQLELAQLVRANATINNLNNVDVFYAAVGSADGSVKIPCFDYTKENNYGAIDSKTWKNGRRTVPVMTIDSVLNGEGCNLIKVDVEGMEKDVLIGAAKTIEKYKPILFVEADKADSAPAVIDYIKELGYDPYWFINTLFTPNNYYNNRQNDFGSQCSFNLLSLPSGSTPPGELRLAKSTDKIGECPIDWIVTRVTNV